LLPDVHGTGTNTAYVNGAWRPGVEKITFLRQPYDPLLGQFTPVTNQFTDAYYSNGVAMTQQVERIVAQPDFLFCAADAGSGNPWAPLHLSSPTSNWCNNAALNGNPAGAGPGVIQPPVKIWFDKLGGTVATWDGGAPGSAQFYPAAWGSYDSSTSQPVVYPGAAAAPSDLTLRLRFYSSDTVQVGNFTWQSPVSMGGAAALETSTNLLDWVTLGVVTNAGGVIEWYNYGMEPYRFFRAKPQ
jgi:hypothetical protein